MFDMTKTITILVSLCCLCSVLNASITSTATGSGGSAAHDIVVTNSLGSWVVISYDLDGAGGQGYARAPGQSVAWSFYDFDTRVARFFMDGVLQGTLVSGQFTDETATPTPTPTPSPTPAPPVVGTSLVRSLSEIEADIWPVVIPPLDLPSGMTGKLIIKYGDGATEMHDIPAGGNADFTLDPAHADSGAEGTMIYYDTDANGVSQQVYAESVLSQPPLSLPPDEAIRDTVSVSAPMPSGYSATVRVTVGGGTPVDYPLDAAGVFSHQMTAEETRAGWSAQLITSQTVDGVTGVISTDNIGSSPAMPQPSPQSVAPIVVSKETAGSATNSSGVVTPVLQYAVAGHDVTSSGTVATSGTITATMGGGASYYAGTSTSGTGSGGSFVPATTAQTDIDLTDVKNLLREGNLDRKRATEQDSAARGNVATPHRALGPTAAIPEDNEFDARGAESIAKGEAVFSKASGIVNSIKTSIPTAPNVGASYGSRLSWECTLPVLGSFNVNLSPYSSIIGAFREFLKFVLSVVSWIMVVKMVRGAFV
jgi:hypothetical protein